MPYCAAVYFEGNSPLPTSIYGMPRFTNSAVTGANAAACTDWRAGEAFRRRFVSCSQSILIWELMIVLRRYAAPGSWESYFGETSSKYAFVARSLLRSTSGQAPA